mgnify:FL=1
MDRKRRHKRITAKIQGTSERPRVCVFRSIKRVSLQAIDDVKGNTIVGVNDADATKAGKELATALLSKKITTVYFDRGGYKYHGKVKAVAEALRKEGIKV